VHTYPEGGGDVTGKDKDEFMKVFEEATGKSVVSFKGRVKAFAQELNQEGREALRALFRAAVQPSPQDDAAAGLANLFGPPS
jgi:hypothetical protein